MPETDEVVVLMPTVCFDNDDEREEHLAEFLSMGGYVEVGPRSSQCEGDMTRISTMCREL